MRKLPHKFSCRFLDDEGIEGKLMIEDWEIGALYWNCLHVHSAVEAPRKVREKYMDDITNTKDPYFSARFILHMKNNLLFYY